MTVEMDSGALATSRFGERHHRPALRERLGRVHPFPDFDHSIDLQLGGADELGVGRLGLPDRVVRERSRCRLYMESRLTSQAGTVANEVRGGRRDEQFVVTEGSRRPSQEPGPQVGGWAVPQRGRS